MATHLYLIRHGETEHNAKELVQGHTNIPLNDTGKAQAAKLRNRIKETYNMDYLISSDLSRAFTTAEILNESLQLDIVKDPRWREINFGIWEGKPWRKLKQEDPMCKEYYKNWLTYKEHQGESWQDVSDRMNEALKEIVENYDGKKIMVVAHGGIIRLMAAQALNVTGKFLPLVLYNTSITEFAHQKDVWTLYRLNDAAHLEENGK